MSFRRTMAQGANAVARGEPGCAGYFGAAIEVVERHYPSSAGYVSQREEYQAEGRIFERLYVTRGKLSGCKVEFLRQSARPEMATLSVARYSKLYGLLLVLFSFIPGGLVTFGMIIAKFNGANIHLLLLMLTAAFVFGVGILLAKMLSGAISRISGKGMSNEELDVLGQAIVDAVAQLDAGGGHG